LALSLVCYEKSGNVNDAGEFAMKDLFAQHVREGSENLISGER